MPGPVPLFSKEFLIERLVSFELSGVVNISGIRRTLKNLKASLDSGKFDSMKEESIKSRFLMELFGDVLGFNYKNPQTWLFQEEVKTEVDGTKPDGALGTFYITETGVKKDVRVVIEVKDSRTDLDEVQKDRPAKISPVDQGMIYSTKMGESCRWVVVTNIREIRFYQANDQTRYQQFLLESLQNEEELRELLFLFLRENFFTGQESSTEGLLRLVRKEHFRLPVAGHIVDQLYYSLKRFDQLSFIDPKLIANMRPFTIMEEYVWHYKDGHLFSLNPEIYQFLMAVSIDFGQIALDGAYENELKTQEVLEYSRKIDYIFEKLYASQVVHFSALKDLEYEKRKNKGTIGYSNRHIMHLTAENSVTLHLKLVVNEECDCLSCTYHSLNVIKLIRKVEQLEQGGEQNNLEVAYGHYLLCSDNFRRSYQIYKTIEREAKGDDQRILEYFCVKYNIKHLHNLILEDAENNAILKDARSIDLDRVVSDELDIFSDKDVRKAMLEIKEDYIFEHAVKRARELVTELKQVRTFMARGGDYTSLPNYADQLYRQFAQVLGHVQKNFLVYDQFTPYKKFIALFFSGMVISYRTKKYGIKNFSNLMLIEAVLYINPKELQATLRPVKTLKLKDKERDSFLYRATAFFASYWSKGIFGDPHVNGQMEKQLLNWSFRDKYTNVFSNLCTILSYIDCTEAQFKPTAVAVISCVKVDGTLAWWDIEQLGKLIERKGSLFDAAQLIDLLKFALENHRLYKTNKYEDLTRRICQGIRQFHPTERFDNVLMTKRALLNCESDNGHRDLRPLSALWHISSDPVKAILTNAFEEHLDLKFDDHLYEHLLKAKVIAYDRKGYLTQLAAHVEKQKGEGFKGFENGKADFSDYISYNFLIIPYVLDLGFDLPEFTSLTHLSPFETWLQGPLVFDYTNFDPRWLLVANYKGIYIRLKSFQPLIDCISSSLKNNYDSELSRIYFNLLA